MSDLKRFLYQNPCPKCGQREASVKWDITRQVLNRTCTRCGYSWDEAPLDEEEQDRQPKAEPQP